MEASDAPEPALFQVVRPSVSAVRERRSATTAARNQKAPNAEYPATLDRPLDAEPDVAAKMMPARMDRPPLSIIGHWEPTVRRRRIASVSWIVPVTRAQIPNTISVALIVEKTAMTIAPAAATLSSDVADTDAVQPTAVAS